MEIRCRSPPDSVRRFLTWFAAVRQTTDELIAMRQTRRLHNLCFRRVFPTQLDIFIYSIVKQYYILKDHGKMRHNRFRINFFQIVAADPHRSRCRVVEPRRQFCDCTLPAPGGADQGRNFPLFGRKADIVQNGCRPNIQGTRQIRYQSS